MQTREIEYQADGRDLIGTLYGEASSDPRPGVVVYHEGPGVSEHAKTNAARLAELGFIAFAADYHGGGVAPPTEEMRPRLMGLLGDGHRTRELGLAALDVLLAQPGVDASRIAAIGYCFGGTMALEVARSGAPVQATVGFHSGLGTSSPQDASNITGSVLVCIGADDPLIPAAQRHGFEEEMIAGGVDWQMHLYGGVQHSFTNHDAHLAAIPGIKYDAEADRRSWAAMLDLFDRQLATRMG